MSADARLGGCSALTCQMFVRIQNGSPFAAATVVMHHLFPPFLTPLVSTHALDVVDADGAVVARWGSGREATVPVSSGVAASPAGDVVSLSVVLPAMRVAVVSISVLKVQWHGAMRWAAVMARARVPGVHAAVSVPAGSQSRNGSARCYGPGVPSRHCQVRAGRVPHCVHGKSFGACVCACATARTSELSCFPQEDVPLPDFSMPYVTIAFASTAVSLFFGGMFNLTARKRRSRQEEGALARAVPWLAWQASYGVCVRHPEARASRLMCKRRGGAPS